MSDAFWIAMFAGIPGIIAAGVAAYIAVTNARVAAAAALTAKNAAAQLTAIAVTGELTHKLANSAMLEQKKLVAVSARAKADVTKDAVDIASAKAAEKIYSDHAARNGR